MKLKRLSQDGEKCYEEDGSATLGATLVGDDHVQRWYTREELEAMTGIGEYSSASGYPVYDGYPVDGGYSAFEVRA